MTADRPATEPRPPTICRCGMAKSYHEGRFSQGHEYEPRYESTAWLDGYRRGRAEAAQGAAPRAEGLPSEAEDWYELDRRILASEQRIVLLEAVIREAVAHIEGFMANGPQQPAGGWYGAQSWLAELPSRLRPSDERQPGDSDDR